MLAYAQELLDLVEAAEPRLRGVTAEVARRRPGAGAWSPVELVGHLVDSASNNHQRFVRARWQDTLVFPGYAQDDWVHAQAYQRADWDTLVTLWATFNRQLAHVMDATPDAVRLQPRTEHNLHEIAWRTVSETEPVTLDYFMRDYVGHLRHHLDQLWTLLP